jgi:hypothetical protein
MFIGVRSRWADAKDKGLGGWGTEALLECGRRNMAVGCMSSRCAGTAVNYWMISFAVKNPALAGMTRARGWA